MAHRVTAGLRNSFLPGTHRVLPPARRAALVSRRKIVNEIRLLKRFAIGTVVLAGSGCGLSTRTPTEEFQGKLGADWDGQTPVSVRAAAHKVYEAPVENGEFRLSVLGQTSYRFAVVRADGTSVPMLFPRGSGLTNDRLAVSGGTEFDFGYVRYVAPFNSGGVVVSTKSANIGQSGTDGEYECENGIEPSTGAACVEEDDEAGSCDGEHEDDDEHEDGDEAEDDDDIECEDGVDARTGAACKDDDDDEREAGHVESDDEAALPDHVPP